MLVGEGEAGGAAIGPVPGVIFALLQRLHLRQFLRRQTACLQAFAAKCPFMYCQKAGSSMSSFRKARMLPTRDRTDWVLLDSNLAGSARQRPGDHAGVGVEEQRPVEELRLPNRR